MYLERKSIDPEYCISQSRQGLGWVEFVVSIQRRVDGGKAHVFAMTLPARQPKIGAMVGPIEFWCNQRGLGGSVTP